MEDNDGSESTEFSMLQIVHDPATLASPDLLSDVSDMKQDLIKMSVLLTSDKSEHSFSTESGQQSEKTGNEEVDEPFVIVEKVKRELEKVEEILCKGTRDETRGGAAGKSISIDNEEWVLLSNADVDELEIKNITKVPETVFQEMQIKQDTILCSPPKRDMSGMVSHLSSDLEQCFTETPVLVSHPQDVDIVQQSFKEVTLTRGSKYRPAEIKKPARRKRKEREFASGSSEDDLERMSRSQSEESLDEDAVIGISVPVFGSVPVSPKVVETPIGSIKDKIKALQNKVEEKDVENQKWKPQKVSASQGKVYVTETEYSNKLSPKSPKSPRSQTERLEETMSVKDLMKAFQTGQDPSKCKSGLFEHKAITTVTSETAGSVVIQVPPHDYQMTVTTQHSQDKVVADNKICKESNVMDPDTTEYNESTIIDHGTPVMTLDSTRPSQNKVSDQTEFISEIIFNFGKQSPLENQSKNEMVDHNEKPSQEPGRFKSEELQKTSKMVINEDQKLIHERLNSICQDRRLSVEPQISPNRKPSEDFSADIKAELEDNAEYQLFRQISGAVNNQYLMCSDGISAEDEEEQIHQAAMDSYSYDADTNIEFTTESVQGEPLLLSEMHDEELEESPDSDKHEALADSPVNSTGIKTPHSSTGDSDKHEGLAETPQTNPEIHVSFLHTTAEDRLPGTLDIENAIEQEVRIRQNTILCSPKRDMSDMVSHLSSDLEQCLKETAVPVSHQQDVDIVQESFKEVVLTRVTEIKMPGREYASGSLEEDLERMSRSQSEESLDENAVSSGSVPVFGSVHVSSRVVETLTENPEDRHPGTLESTTEQEVRIKRDTILSSPPKRHMSGMVSHLSSDLEQCLKETPVPVSHPQDVDVVQESFEEAFLTRDSKHHSVEIKMPAREFGSGSLEEDLEKMSRSQSEESLDENAVSGGSVPVFESVSVPPRFVETPIENPEDRHPGTLENTIEQEVRIIRDTIFSCPPERDMSDMVSHLSSDLVQCLEEKAVTVSHPQDVDIVQESFKEVVLTRAAEIKMPAREFGSASLEKDLERMSRSQSEESLDENAVSGGSVLVFGSVSVSPRVVETQFENPEDRHPETLKTTTEQEVRIKQDTILSSPPKRDMSDMVSHLSSDLVQCLEEMPVPVSHPGNVDIVQESFKEVVLTHGTKHNLAEVKMPAREFGSGNLEDDLERMSRSQSEESLDEDPVNGESIPVFGSVSVSSRVVETPIENPEHTHPGTLETEGTTEQDVRIKRDTVLSSPPKRDMSDMDSHLSSDFEQCLKETPVPVSHPQDVDVAQESFEEDFLTHGSKHHSAEVKMPAREFGSSNLEDDLERMSRSQSEESLDEDAVIAISEPIFGSGHVSPRVVKTLTQDRMETQETESTNKQAILVTSYERSESDKSDHISTVISLKDKTESPFLDESRTDLPSPSTKTESPSPNDSKIDSLLSFTKAELPSTDDSNIIIQDTIQVMQYSYMESMGSETTVQYTESTSACSESRTSIDSDIITGPEGILQYTLHSEDAPNRPFHLDSLESKTITDSKTLCQTDSLESSPMKEDLSSHKSPDSIEPSPIKESPCPDSLDGSPTGQGHDLQVSGQLSYIERVFSTSQNLITHTADSMENTESQKKSESFQSLGTQQTSDIEDVSMTLDPKESDSDDLEDTDALQRQFTPEDQMFKMAAKIKTFDEMEKDAKKKKVKFDFDCISKQPKEEVLSLQQCPLDCNTVLTKESQEQWLENLTESDPPGPVSPLSSGDDYDSPNLAKSPPKVSEETSQVLKTMDEDEKDHSHLGTVDLQPCTYIPSVQAHIENEEDYEKIHSEYQSVEIGEAYTTDETEQDVVVTSQLHIKLEIEIASDVENKSPGESQTFEKITEPISPLDLMCTNTAENKVPDESQAVACIYEEDHKGISVEIPSSPRDLVPWSAEIEDDEAFDARIEAEEQKILALCTDRRSRETTPDTTPGRTPTEEGTPNPFLFQEGKLFEMTRGGAIDMTRRTAEDEEERVFFPINEDQSEQDTFEQATFDTSESSFELPLDGILQQDQITDESDSKSEAFNDTETEALLQSNFQEPTDFSMQSEQESPTENHLIYEDTLIPNIDTATSTVTRTVYSEQDLESSDSSVEDDQHSVVEMPLFTQESDVSTSVSDHTTESKEIVTEIEDITPKPKIHIKAASFDRTLGQGDSTERSQRPKSEADLDHSEWSMYVAEDHINIDYPKQKTLSSQQPSPQEQDDLPQPSIQPEPSFECSKELDPTKTEFEKIKGDRASLDSDIESNLKIVRPPSIGEDVFDTRPNWEDSVETQMQRISDSTTPDQCKADWHDDADRKEETLAIIADLLGFSWTELAKELEFNVDEIQQVRAENPNSLQEQSHALLQRWVEREGKHATEDTLIKRLTKINRMDIVHLIEIQMHKSVQEQTSRTYAEIEKTLDHSEALSSVQEDIESVRVVRRVETSQRHPPAVSEEDLSVASLLDIPSWAETMGNAHSESIHGDLMEELEISQDSFTNQWPSQELKKEPTNEAAEGDDVPDIPPQSVTEEQYTDAQGNLVVKKVTRKVIRRCVSSDGVEREQVMVEGSEQQPVSVEQGDGYSRVIKRTVLKSEGHQTEVTFHERDVTSSSKEETAGGSQIRQVVQTTVVHGEHLEKQEGDSDLAADLSSARDDFTQDEDAEV